MVSAPGNRAPVTPLHRGAVSWRPGRELLLGTAGWRHTKAAAAGAIRGTGCVEKDTEDTAMRTLQGQRRRVVTGGKNSATDAKGAVRPQDRVRQVTAVRW